MCLCMKVCCTILKIYFFWNLQLIINFRRKITILYANISFKQLFFLASHKIDWYKIQGCRGEFLHIYCFNVRLACHDQSLSSGGTITPCKCGYWVNLPGQLCEPDSQLLDLKTSVYLRCRVNRQRNNTVVMDLLLQPCSASSQHAPATYSTNT